MSEFVKVKVFPVSKRERVIKKSDDNFEIYVKEKPENGKANKAVIAALAAYFNIRESHFKLIKGHRQRNKIFEII